jgi:biopolymer transport protein ExbB/TolQ
MIGPPVGVGIVIYLWIALVYLTVVACVVTCAIMAVVFLGRIARGMEKLLEKFDNQKRELEEVKENEAEPCPNNH